MSIDPATAPRDAPAGVFMRRDILRFAGGFAATVGGGMLLAACGSGSSGASGPLGSATDAATGPVGGALNLFTWQGYDLTKPFASWREQNDIQQKVKYLNNQFDVASILKGPGGKNYDVSTANQAYTNLFQKLGLMQEMTADDVPSLAKMYPYFKDSPIWRWGGSADSWNSVPWTWGAVGLNWLTDKVDKPTSWNMLIDPKNKGRVGTIDDGYNNVSIAAIALGIDLTQITPTLLNGPIKEWLIKLKSNLKTISVNLGDQQTLLVNGEVDYMNVGLSLFKVGAEEQGAKDVGFTIPSEGGFGFCDAAFVTPWAPDKANAFAFCEALLGGKTAATAADALSQGVAVPSVVPMLKPATKALYPYDNLQDYLANDLKFEVNFTPNPGQDIASFDDVNNLWQDIKAG